MRIATKTSDQFLRSEKEVKRFLSVTMIIDKFLKGVY